MIAIAAQIEFQEFVAQVAAIFSRQSKQHREQNKRAEAKRRLKSSKVDLHKNPILMSAVT